MNPQRVILLIISLAALAGGSILLLQDSPQSQTYSGILIRVGCMLGALWLAFPQLASLRNRFSMVTLAVMVLLLLLVAARPRIFPIAAAVAIATILLNGLLRKLSGNLPRR